MSTTTSTTTPIDPSTTPPTTATTPPPTTTTTTEPPTTTTTPPTTTPTTTSTTTTTSEDTSTTTTSSETTSSTTGSSETTSSSSSVVTTTSTPLTTRTTTSGGLTETVIVTQPLASASQSAVSDTDSGGKGFFDNTGAVAGVFTVVGLVALVLFVVLATNAIRRRRAKKFDDEVAAAAAEANASPRYPFDDYDDPAPGGGYGAYSDPDSHGTMSQVPLTHHGESYNMNEFNGGYGPSYGAAATAVGTGVSAGAAGIGTSRSLARRNTSPNNNYSDVGGAGIAGFGASQNGVHSGPGQVAPFNAFAGPLNTMPADPYDPYTAGTLGIKRQNSYGAADLLDAAGLGAAAGGAAGALNRGPSQSTPAQSLDRTRSSATHRTLSPDNSNGSASGKTQESYAAHYQPDFRPDAHQYQRPPASAGEALPNPFARDAMSDEDAYGVDSYIPAAGHSPAHDDGRMSIRDEEDYGRAGRTLKVANE